MKVNIILLAAGMGKRMYSDTPKVLHKVAGVSMLETVYNQIKKINIEENLITVLSDEVLSSTPEFFKDISYVIQKNRLGTGDACKVAIKSDIFNNSAEYTGVLYADTPLITSETISKIISLLEKSDLIVGSFVAKDQSQPYGRILTNADTKVSENDLFQINGIKEFKDFKSTEIKPTLCNSGIIFAKTEIFTALIDKIQNNNAANEYYLTDIVQLASEHGFDCKSVMINESEILGVNSKVELSIAENQMQQRLRLKHMQNGVTLINPETVFFSQDTEIGKDVIIEPNVFFGTKVKIGNKCTIASFSYLTGVETGESCTIGPFARIRPNTQLNNNIKIGNFVEVKASKIGSGTKVSHLTYVGDADIGENVNFGAGTIICNYDGKNKHKTTIGDNVMIGSNSSLIAPINIENDTYIGAGSVITKTVEKFALAISRTKQENIKDWVKRRIYKNN